MANSDMKATGDGSVRPVWRRPAVLWTLAILTLILGYADLVRGGVTVAPFLLVIGYCVLLPMAILG